MTSKCKKKIYICLLLIETFEKYMQKWRRVVSDFSEIGLRLIGASFVHSTFTNANCKSRKRILIYVITVLWHRAISNRAIRSTLCSIGSVDQREAFRKINGSTGSRKTRDLYDRNKQQGVKFSRATSLSFPVITVYILATNDVILPPPTWDLSAWIICNSVYGLFSFVFQRT